VPLLHFVTKSHGKQRETVTKWTVFQGKGARRRPYRLEGGACVKQEQKELIRPLRLHGWGYKRIAKELRLNRNQVQLYCKTHGLVGAGEFVKLNLPIS